MKYITNYQLSIYKKQKLEHAGCLTILKSKNSLLSLLFGRKIVYHFSLPLPVYFLTESAVRTCLTLGLIEQCEHANLSRIAAPLPLYDAVFISVEPPAATEIFQYSK